MGPVRRLIPTVGMIDISPIVVFFGLRILQSAICSLHALTTVRSRVHPYPGG